MLKLFLFGGWLPFAFVFLWGTKELWVHYIQNQWGAEQKSLLLAIDIPRGNDVSLRSVENLFTYLAGAHATTNLVDDYWIGKYQLNFSFEIVSIDGYTQFLVQTPVIFKDLVESAIYSVYPDAEISEVNDYVDNVPNRFPDNEYDLWGGEFIQAMPDCYPFKTYPAFEDPSSPPELTFKDPLASLMDLYSTLRPGEQLWYQIIVSPTGFTWMGRGDAEVSRILKEKVPSKKNFVDHIIDVFLTTFSTLASFADLAWQGDASEKVEEKDDALKMMNLKPKEKKQIEAIEEKASKLGFECKIRMMYISKKEVTNKPKALNGFVGYIKQFIDQDTNNLKPDMDITATTVNYFFRDSRIRRRQNSMMQGYKNRSGNIGRKLKIFNIEELATLWHFPIEAVVRAPLIQKAPGRKSEPPMTLPLEEAFSSNESGFKKEGSAPSGIFAKEVLSENSGDQEGIFLDEDSSKKAENKKSTLPDFFSSDEQSDTSSDNEAPGNLPFV